MLTLVPECLPAYKKLIDDGYAEDFGTSLHTERRFSGAANKAVSSSAIEARREQVRARGQQQKS
jgi:enoyl-CoA hydratase